MNAHKHAFKPTVLDPLEAREVPSSFAGAAVHAAAVHTHAVHARHHAHHVSPQSLAFMRQMAAAFGMPSINPASGNGVITTPAGPTTLFGSPMSSGQTTINPASGNGVTTTPAGPTTLFGAPMSSGQTSINPASSNGVMTTGAGPTNLF